MGAIASGGVRVLNQDVVSRSGVDEDTIDRVADDELRELRRREDRYRQGRGPLDLEGRNVILVDDGLATGATMRAAAKALRQRNPARMVIAVPVAPPDTCRQMRDEGEDVVCLATPAPFMGVGRWYRSFHQTQDEEVIELLDERIAEFEGG
jgi:predicted phosphoribosyltransferase